MERLSMESFILHFSFDRLSFPEDSSIIEWKANDHNEGELRECIFFYLSRSHFTFQLHFEDCLVRIHPSDSVPYCFINLLLTDRIARMIRDGRLEQLPDPFDSLYNDKIDFLYFLWKRLDHEERLDIRELLRTGQFYITNQLALFDVILRYEENERLVKAILHFASDDNPFPDFIENKRMALYGAGQIGQLLAAILLRKGILLTCFIDQYSSLEQWREIPVRKVENVEPDELDLIIVTPTYAFNRIRHDLRDRFFCPILSAFDLVGKNGVDEMGDPRT